MIVPQRETHSCGNRGVYLAHSAAACNDFGGWLAKGGRLVTKLRPNGSGLHSLVLYRVPPQPKSRNKIDNAKRVWAKRACNSRRWRSDSVQLCRIRRHLAVNFSFACFVVMLVFMAQSLDRESRFFVWRTTFANAVPIDYSNSQRAEVVYGYYANLVRSVRASLDFMQVR
jgi:hypothetical protein